MARLRWFVPSLPDQSRLGDASTLVTPSLEQVATMMDGATAFVKTPTSEVTGQMLVDEIAACEAMGVPDAAVHHVSFLTGCSARHAPLPVIPDAPRVRRFQLDQLRVCLPRFARLVG